MPYDFVASIEEAGVVKRVFMVVVDHITSMLPQKAN
jgi:hypothetical protein